MAALIGLPGDPGATGYTLAPDGPAVAGETVNVLVSRHRGLPRDRMGNRLSASGRSLIAEALHRTYGRRITAGDLARDGLKRWSVPALGLSASVAHVGAYSAVAFAPAGRVIGVDLQDERDRPHALRWLGDLLGREEPATIRDFAECEALIKASHLTKETFAGTRLPAWRPGWRPVNTETYEVRSVVLRAEGEPPLHLALACDAPAPVRFHHLEEE
ncbi:hypothetical protein [Streptomyces sp. NBC_00525]|uniref:hypothetical protein n=1 Tax=Streptomyces sp. NBC_00525 TaxID=2903660 RepID=UPI002E804372|nr:hypothetical protein [Streptomyces sp. NBC_00525]WUC94401.1 hypothetical protein OG710_12750 [Streptomyces sp. NBC_00525]